MDKTYSYYGICFDDVVVGPNGGMTIKPQCFDREPRATNKSVKALMNDVSEQMSKATQDFGPVFVTGLFSHYDDPVNDYSFIIHGNHYFEGIGVIKPMVEDWVEQYS